MTAALAFESFVLAAILSLGLGPLCMSVAARMHWMDRPGHRKIHQKPVPYLGGVALFAAIALACVLSVSVFGLLRIEEFNLKAALACALPAFGAACLGLWDDVLDVPARYKFPGQVALALLFSIYAYRFSALHIPGFLPLVLGPSTSVFATTFVILAIVNGFNMIDGSDGLCLGASMVTLLQVALAAYGLSQPQFTLLALIAAGACLGLIFWNRTPARIYLGDAGSQGLGFLVACMLVALGRSGPGRFATLRLWEVDQQPFHYAIILACVMGGWPVIEVSLTVARRLLQGRGLGQADQGHLHHRLGRLGFKPGSIVLMAMAVNLLCGSVALLFMADEKGLAILLAAPAAIFFSFGLLRLDYTRFFDRAWLEHRRPYFAVAAHFGAMQRAKLKLVRSDDEVLVLVARSCEELRVHACRISYNGVSGERKSWRWSVSGPIPGLSIDRLRLPGTRTHATWSADPRDDREPELSMNLRVVMVDFMRQALERLGELGAAGTVASETDPTRSKEFPEAHFRNIKPLRQRP